VKDIPIREVWPILTGVIIILLIQGTWLFLDARKRGGKTWFWGLWGMISFPWPTVTYTLLLWWSKRKAKLTNEFTEE
jgi:hypothetical protein